MDSLDNKKKCIRVLHVTFNMGFGGTEAVIRALTTSDETVDVQHLVACIDGEVGTIGRQIAKQGIPIKVLKRSPGFDWSLLNSLRKLIISERIDVVHCHQYSPWVYGTLATVLTKAKPIFTEHGRFHPDRYRYKAIVANRVLASLTKSIIAISAATRSALARYEFLSEKRIQIIYNGIQPLQIDAETVAIKRKELGFPSNCMILGTVARLDPVKNQKMMLEAFARVLESYPLARLVIVGDGPELSSLKDAVNRLGIDRETVFTGFSETPAEYLGFMDVFLLSSDTEGTSMTLLEAMSLGLPVVATAAGGTPEIVTDGVTGFVTPTGDATSFAIAIENILSDRERASELGRQGYQRFLERFSASAMTTKYLEVYRSVMSTISDRGL